MGNGARADADKSTSAYMASISYLNGPAVSMYMRSTTKAYPLSILSARTFRYGGPGRGSCSDSPDPAVTESASPDPSPSDSPTDSASPSPGDSPSPSDSTTDGETTG
jgi:hypothetical protein